MTAPMTPEQWASRIAAELNIIALDYGHDDIISVHANEVATLMARLMAEFRNGEVEQLRAELDKAGRARDAYLDECNALCSCGLHAPCPTRRALDGTEAGT